MNRNETEHKPVIGVLGIMQELYLDMFPGIVERQEKYARELTARLDPVADIRFHGAVYNRERIERGVAALTAEGCDGIMIVMLTYGASLLIVNAFRDLTLPLFLANVQPEQTVSDRWDMADLTYNQGIHGAQDTANALLRMGKTFTVFTGDWHSPAFVEAVGDFAAAAQARSVMRQSRVAVFGQMPGMGDILTDPNALMRRLGPQIDHLGTGELVSAMQEVTPSAIAAVVDECRRHFAIDPKLGDTSLEEAARLQIAIKTVLDRGRYASWTLYFNAIGLDGRFRQIHMMAASNLMAAGYGYAAEGDSNCASLMIAGRAIADDPCFTEMYAMDFPKDAFLQSHMGEGNWKIARKDRPIRLIDRPLAIGGLDNPPTVVFQGQPGPATLASLVSLAGETYRLVVTQGEILDTSELPKVEMPNFFFHPRQGIVTCMNGWLKAGGTHHQVLHLGDQRRRWAEFCRISGIEYVEV